MKLLFNKASIESLPPGTHYDTKLPGLVVNVTEHSRRFGVYKWSKRDQKPVRVAIGPYPAFSVERARSEAQEIIYKLDRGEAASDSPRVAKLGDLADDYERALRATGAKDPAANSRIVDLGAADWRSKPATAITRAMVQERHNEIAASRGPTAAGRFVKVLRALYRHADLPCPATKIKIATLRPRQRVATPEEMERIKAELAKQPEQWRDYFLLSILTGARRDNVASMRFEDVKDGVWTIPAADAKMGEPIVLPLLPEASEIIERRRAVIGSGYVFRSHSKTGRLVSTWDRWQEVRVAAGVPDMTQHDLRRSFISRLAEADVHPAVASRLAGHRSVTTTLKHYTVVNERMMREALGKISG